MSKLPEYPTIKLGYVHGPIRYEALDGSEIFIDADRFLKNQGPREVDGKIYGVTHLQKRSKFGFLWASPFCFHFWYSFRYQLKNEFNQWVSGSERVFYVRTPGWRWDIAGTMIDGVMQHWIRTKGYLNASLHWD